MVDSGSSHSGAKRNPDPPHPPVGAPEIERQLNRILDTERFRRAPQLSRFLRFTVEQALQGNRESLKEYSIGVEVLGRTEKFDPRVDPVVRVRARNLRAS